MGLSSKLEQLALSSTAQFDPPMIPRRRYIDAGFHRLELDRLWRTSWLLVGHRSEYKEPGNYRLLDIPLAPVVTVLGHDSVLRAFLNSCRHRGAPVVRESQGKTRVMSCQYHGWTYDLCGRLVGVPEEERFPCLDKGVMSLQAVRCELWGGFVFINFDADAPPLLEWLPAGFQQRYSEIAAAPLRVLSKQSWTLDCNWKIAVEAFRESYHVDLIHRQTASRVLLSPQSSFETYGNGFGTMISPYRPDLLNNAEWRGAMAMSSVPTLTGTQGEDYARSALMGYFFPNAFFGFQRAGFPAVMKWPLAVDRTHLDVVWYGMDWGTGPLPSEWEPVIAGFTQLVNEDIANMAPMQRSLEADPGKAVPLGRTESLLYTLHAEIDRVIGIDLIAPELRTPIVDAAYFSATTTAK